MNVSFNQTLLPPGQRNGIEIIELVFLVIICVLTLLGNCLVILAFMLGPRSIRNYTNYFVVNLAVCDLMVGCLSLPFWIVYRIGMCAHALHRESFIRFLPFRRSGIHDMKTHSTYVRK